jgi:hypothetical protein
MSDQPPSPPTSNDATAKNAEAGEAGPAVAEVSQTKAGAGSDGAGISPSDQAQSVKTAQGADRQADIPGTGTPAHADRPGSNAKQFTESRFVPGYQGGAGGDGKGGGGQGQGEDGKNEGEDGKGEGEDGNGGRKAEAPKPTFEKGDWTRSVPTENKEKAERDELEQKEKQATETEQAQTGEQKKQNEKAKLGKPGGPKP